MRIPFNGRWCANNFEPIYVQCQETRRWGIVYLLDGQDLFSDGQDSCNCWAMCFVRRGEKKKIDCNSREVYTRLGYCRGHNFEGEKKEVGPFFFFATIPHLKTGKFIFLNSPTLVSYVGIGTSEKSQIPCFSTLGVSFARKTIDPRKDFHFTHCSQGGWAKYPGASKSIKLVFGCHLIRHQCFSAFQTHKCGISRWRKNTFHCNFLWRTST